MKLNTKMKAISPYLRDSGVIRVTFGKVGYDNPNRKTNLTEVEFGFRRLTGNEFAYFSITGGLRNCRNTDYVTCGASVHEKVQEFVHDPLLAELIKIGKKYHLTDEPHIPEKVVKRVKDIIAALLDEYKAEHPAD